MLVRYQFEKVQIDAPSTLGSKVTSIGDKLVQVRRVLGIFQGSILRDTTRTRSILGFDSLKYCWTQSILGFNTLEFLLNLKYLGILYCSYMKYLECLGSSYSKNFNTRSISGFSYSEIRVILGVFQGFRLHGTSGWSITRSILLRWRTIPGFNTRDTRSTPSFLDICNLATACTRV